MIHGILASFGRHRQADPRYTNYLNAAKRGMKPLPAPKGPMGPPKAPGLSSRISPGTVPMKKGMR